MAENSGKNAIRIARIDGQCGNSLAVAKAQMCPGLAGVRGFVDSIAYRQVRACQTFSARHINDVWSRRGYSDGPDRLRVLGIKDRIPRATKVIGLPNPAIHLSHVENIWLTRHSARGASSPAARRANHAPAHLLVGALRILLCASGSSANKNSTQSERNDQKRIQSPHMTPLRNMSKRPSRLLNLRRSVGSSDFDPIRMPGANQPAGSTMNRVCGKLNAASAVCTKGPPEARYSCQPI